MPDLRIQVAAAKVVPFAAAPTIAFQLEIGNAVPAEEIHTIALRCQIQIEVTRRGYAPHEQARLLDLFGHPDRWGQTLRNLLWTHTSMVVPAFEGASTAVDMNVPCTFDFNVASTKYFDGLTGGDIPLLMLFSGTVFYASPESDLQVAPISWELEARYKLPVNTWREMMDIYYPNSVCISLQKDVFEQLYRYKIERGIPTWEQALERLLANEAMVRA
jgi:Family of unknown function (DUF6084)